MTEQLPHQPKSILEIFRKVQSQLKTLELYFTKLDEY